MTTVAPTTLPAPAGHFIHGQFTGDHAGNDGDDPGAAAFHSCTPMEPGRSLGVFPRGDTATCDRAVRGTREAQRLWARRAMEERLAVLDVFAEALRERRTQLATLITEEMGKPRREALAEADALAAKWEITRSTAAEALTPQAPAGAGGFWDWRPLGVMAVIGPFNFPMHLSNGHILPALVAGNGVVLKPSEHAPLCAQAYVEAWQATAAQTGAPPALLSLVHGDGQTGAALVEHPGIDAVAFTGSLPVGQAILRTLAPRPWVLPALEMGGKNAAVVCADANIPLAARRIAAGAWQTTGQRCTATSRVIVHRDVADTLFDALIAETARWVPGDPHRPDTLLGPLATAPAAHRFREAQETPTPGLRTLLAGGRAPVPPTPDGWWVCPAIHLVESGAQPRRWRDELFGPELLVRIVDTDEDAVDAANDSDYGLAVSVFTASRARFDRMRPGIHAGLIHWNRATAGASSAMPFGGVRGSGNHRPAGILSLRYCVHPVATLLDPGTDPDEDEA